MTEDKVVNKVYSSKDYKKFSFLDSNRELKTQHVDELKESMQETPLEKPIDVNEKFEIIDGQHRYMAWWDLGMPVIYIIHDGWGAKEVPILNTHQKNWKPSDYVHMYSEMGKEDYKQYDEFSKRFGFTHNANLLLLNGASGYKLNASFNEGTFKVTKWVRANILGRQIIQFKSYYPGFKRQSFIMAYLQLADEKNFEHDQLMDKIAFQSRKMVHCTTTGEYFSMLKEIYNYKARVNRID